MFNPNNHTTNKSIWKFIKEANEKMTGQYRHFKACNYAWNFHAMTFVFSYYQLCLLGCVFISYMYCMFVCLWYTPEYGNIINKELEDFEHRYIFCMDTESPAYRTRQIIVHLWTLYTTNISPFIIYLLVTRIKKGEGHICFFLFFFFIFCFSDFMTFFCLQYFKVV